jgi:hypothetical protein
LHDPDGTPVRHQEGKTMSARIPLSAGLLVLALLGSFAAAQTLYKSTTPDGRVIYSDKPPADAVKTEKRQMDTSKQGVVSPSNREKAALQQMETDRRARESANDRLRKAEIALHDAQVARDMGKEPLGSERLGTAGGGQRLTDGYWARQKKLEEAVGQARLNLDRIKAGK